MIFKMEREAGVTKNLSDFSIDHILNKAGATNNSSNGCEDVSRRDLNTFSWLQCTRFCPPKIPRVQKKDPPVKRQLGRYPRIPFTNEQIAALEEKFQESPYLSSEEAVNLSKRLQLADVKVKIWFQNRRARKRREENTRRRNEERIVGENVDRECAGTSDEQKTFLYVNSQSLFDFERR